MLLSELPPPPPLADSSTPPLLIRGMISNLRRVSFLNEAQISLPTPQPQPSPHLPPPPFGGLGAELGRGTAAPDTDRR